MEQQKTTQIVEALLFAAETPLSVRQLRNLLSELDPEQVGAAVAELRQRYNEEEPDRGIELVQVAGGWRFRTRADLSPWVRRLYQQTPLRIGRAMLEVLAIVAYRQPVTRAEVDAIRGVDSAGSLRALLERELVRVVGRKDLPGRPQLYGTTKKFLEVFGLRSLGELPALEEDLEQLQQRLPLADQEAVAALHQEAETESDSDRGDGPGLVARAEPQTGTDPAETAQGPPGGEP